MTTLEKRMISNWIAKQEKFWDKRVKWSWNTMLEKTIVDVQVNAETIWIGGSIIEPSGGTALDFDTDQKFDRVLNLIDESIKIEIKENDSDEKII